MLVKESVLKLEEYAYSRKYKGHDPYDALSSPIFKLPILRSNSFIRFSSQQLVKRFPINLRPLLYVPEGLNPVSIGLFIQGYAYLSEVYPDKKEKFLIKIELLTDQLKKMKSIGFSGTCWGYNFDWESRTTKRAAHYPTVVATGIIVNGLFEAWKKTGSEDLRKMIIDSSKFVVNDLNRTYEGSTFCFSYCPNSHTKVLNASMKGARLLSQVFHISKNISYKNEAEKAVRFVVNKQNSNGSWNYSVSNIGKWVDNYHTGYILDCIMDYMYLCDDMEFNDAYTAGMNYYVDNFFDINGQPWFYNNKKFPADCTAASQSINSLVKSGNIVLAKKVAEWTIRHMQSNEGGFYFRKFKNYTVKTSFMRWSNAWMFAALSYLLTEMNNDTFR